MGRVSPTADVVVVGAGFGGLSAALHLADAGRSVVLCEQLRYPGGCASTYARAGSRWETGATLFAGLGPGGWMRGWLDRFDLDVGIELLDPVSRLRLPDLELVVHASREAFADALCALPGAPADGIRRWLAFQRRAADPLWDVLANPDLLPPLTGSAWATHLGRLPRYLRLAGLVGRPLGRILARYGVDRFPPFRAWADAASMITVQTPAAVAEAPFAVAALDWSFRGVAHVRGGVGRLAEATVEAIRRRGGEVHLANRVRAIVREGDRWRVVTRAGDVVTPTVVANLLPSGITALTGMESRRLARDQARVESGWSAVMHYLHVADEGLPPHAFHLQAVADPDAPLEAGNHVLVSVMEREDGRAPPGQRGVTVSAHLRPDPEAPDEARTATVREAQARMLDTLRQRVPELRVLQDLTASPRTFERFTRREGGWVGGVPRVAGLGHYRELWPRPVLPGLWMVGDSGFPGQSVLAVAVGGYRVAAALR